MNKPAINAVLLALGLASAVGARAAEGMSKDDYRAARDRIDAEYRSARTHCAAFAGNRNDICVAEAKGRQDVARAELEARYKPTIRNRFDARVARAEADYAAAKERCDDLNGDAKEACLKEAKAVLDATIADAKRQMDAPLARSDKPDGQYAIEQRRCEIFLGHARDRCVEQARTRASN